MKFEAPEINKVSFETENVAAEGVGGNGLEVTGSGADAI